MENNTEHPKVRTSSNGELACLAAMLDCKKCGGRPSPMTAGGLIDPRHYWACSGCGEHGKYSRTYADAYDQWQKHNGKEH